jgi:hypothetical protein
VAEIHDQIEAEGIVTQKVRFDFPLSEIGDVSKEKGPGPAKQVVVVSPAGGEPAKFTLKDCDGWVEAIRDAKVTPAQGG